jgi:hypothetical protein
MLDENADVSKDDAARVSEVAVEVRGEGKPPGTNDVVRRRYAGIDLDADARPGM